MPSRPIQSGAIYTNDGLAADEIRGGGGGDTNSTLSTPSFFVRNPLRKSRLNPFLLMFPRSTILYLFRQTRINDSNPISLRPDLFPISHPISLFPLPDLKIPSKKSPTLSPPPPSDRPRWPGRLCGVGLGFRWVCAAAAAASSHHQHASGAKANEFREEEEEEEEERVEKPFSSAQVFFSLLLLLFLLQRQQRRQVDPFHAAIASFKAGGGAKGGGEVLQEVMPN